MKCDIYLQLRIFNVNIIFVVLFMATFSLYKENNDHYIDYVTYISDSANLNTIYLVAMQF